MSIKHQEVINDYKKTTSELVDELIELNIEYSKLMEIRVKYEDALQSILNVVETSGPPWDFCLDDIEDIVRETLQIEKR